jgi:hypothetical protein
MLKAERAKEKGERGKLKAERRRCAGVRLNI